MAWADSKSSGAKNRRKMPERGSVGAISSIDIISCPPDRFLVYFATMIRERTDDERLHALGQSEAFIELQERISEAARTDRPVIFIGERGAGKELAAARLHLLSARWNQPYVTLNCAALTPTLIESELFGHEAGAFTGAVRQRKGRFEMAHGGSLFLDEVANIPMTAQEKILRVVEYGRMERVGGTTTIEVDARLIAATNVDLPEMARRGRFRRDLLDRLSFEVITLPPLRARRGDVMLLAHHFAQRMAVELGREDMPAFTERAERALIEHPWPGNVRELKNVVERMVYRTPTGEEIDEIVFDPFDSPYAPRGVVEMDGAGGGDDRAGDGSGADGRDSAGASGEGVGRAAASAGNGRLSANRLESLPFEEAVRELEVHRLRRALTAAQFNQRKAAERLGLTYHQFRGYYRKYKDELAEE